MSIENGEVAMSDFLLILWLSTMMWVSVMVKEQQHEVNQQLAMMDENMAEVWVASEQLTARLKQCEKRKVKR